MIYDISHRTAYHYKSVVTQSQHLVHLAPREFDYQTIHRHSLLVEPAPNTRSNRRDYFENPISILEIDQDHHEFVMHARSVVEVEPRASIELGRGIGWEDLRSIVTRPRNGIDLDAAQFAVPSPFTSTSPKVIDYAAASFVPGRPALDAAWDLTKRIFADFTFDGEATDVSTPVDHVLSERRGVCQDFAHVALASCRAFGIPARYVSGYLLTKPPEGKEKLQGSDASHAWFALWTPDTGWVDFDPTNNLMPSMEHIAFAVGREYRDIAPITGILLGGGEHTVDVAVDVVPIATLP
ncbi:MAG: transglutaminase family protein [Hyphomicrobiaceae bacterium]